jgi:hypothetical protein
MGQPSSGIILFFWAHFLAAPKNRAFRGSASLHSLWERAAPSGLRAPPIPCAAKKWHPCHFLAGTKAAKTYATITAGIHAGQTGAHGTNRRFGLEQKPQKRMRLSQPASLPAGCYLTNAASHSAGRRFTFAPGVSPK